jgi:uncharacterized repeat protein (TIGR01451 family)
MASPHVAGLVGLLISADPGLRGQVEAIETLIEHTAVPRINLACGGDPSGVPNNFYGWGRIDALAAYQAIPQQFSLTLSKIASAAAILPGEPLNYTLTVTNTHAISPTTNVVLTDTIPSGSAFLEATQPTPAPGMDRMDLPQPGWERGVSVTRPYTPPTSPDDRQPRLRARSGCARRCTGSGRDECSSTPALTAARAGSLLATC